MKRGIKIVLLLLLVLEARADLPTKNYPYTLRSANNEYYLRSIPFSMFGTMGRTYVYNNKTGKEIYTVDRFFADASFLSNDGQYIVSVIYRGSHNLPLNDSIYGDAIEFYSKNEKIKSYKITDLVKKKSRLSFSSSSVFWRYGLTYYDKKRKEWIVPTDSTRTRMESHSAYASNDTLYITTVEKKTIAFYIPTGEIIKKKDATKFFKAKSNYSFPVSLKEKMPAFNQWPGELPLLANGEGDLSYALAYLLNYKRASPGNYYDAIVTINLLLDRQTGTIEKLEVEGKTASGEDKKGDLFSDVIKQKILDWLQDKRFQTAAWAPWIEKWYYYENYHFTFQ